VGRVLATGLVGDHAIAGVAAAQYGLVTRAQLLRLGLSPRTIDHRLSTGRLHRLHRGVYAVGHLALLPWAREMAAVLACGPHAVLSHQSAAALWCLRPRHEGEVHVTISRGGSSSRPGVRMHRSRCLDACDVRIRHRIPVTSPSRTIIDLAGLLRERDLARTVDEAEVRGLARRSELLAALERAGNGRRGSAVLAQILRRDKPAMTRSEAEHRLISLMARAGLPRPEVNVPIGGYEVDLLWRRARLVVEVDGYVFH
jgi:hypothetical protein